MVSKKKPMTVAEAGRLGGMIGGKSKSPAKLRALKKARAARAEDRK